VESGACMVNTRGHLHSRTEYLGNGKGKNHEKKVKIPFVRHRYLYNFGADWMEGKVNVKNYII